MGKKGQRKGLWVCWERMLVSEKLWLSLSCMHVVRIRLTAAFQRIKDINSHQVKKGHERKQRFRRRWNAAMETSSNDRGSLDGSYFHVREAVLYWCEWVCMHVFMWAAEEYLHSQAVIRHRHTGVTVPAHVHGGVGTVVRLLVQWSAGGVHVILRLLLQRDLIRRSWGEGEEEEAG